MKSCNEDTAKVLHSGNIATHQSPAWRDKANYILHVDLAPYKMSGRFEQLWAKQIGKGRFTICCIPFFTYGIALGDTVATGADDLFQKVIRRGSHQTLRVAITKARSAPRIHTLLQDWVEQIGALHEWFGHRYLAVDLTHKDKGLDLSFLPPIQRAREIAFEVDGNRSVEKAFMNKPKP